MLEPHKELKFNNNISYLNLSFYPLDLYLFPIILPEKDTEQYTPTPTHTHTRIYIYAYVYAYIYIYVCVCCVCV